VDRTTLSRRRVGFWSCALVAGSLGLACSKPTSGQPTPATSGTAVVAAKSGPLGGTAETPATVPQSASVSLQQLGLGAGLNARSPTAPAKAIAQHVVVLSVDGLAPRFLEMLLDGNKAPNFAALQKQAAWTHHARADKTHTITLPNHTCMVTGLPVSASTKYGPHFAHNYVENIDPMPGDTLHRYRLPAGSYTGSMFDVAHDNGSSTAMFASKTKFVLYEQTYNGAGGLDKVGADNGTKKIDTVVVDQDPAMMVAAFVKQMQTKPPALSFVHLNQPDGAGHGIGWGTPAYMTAVQMMDALLGQIVGVLQSPSLAGKSALIVTADHGGVNNHHADQTDQRNFEIPFYLLAPGVAPGDAYGAFSNRFEPGNENPSYEAEKQPLRNGDAGNLALFMLGFSPIPESVIHSAGLRTK
jgi:predicted AlkP superfamily pyrophosphatase or phosphodiesterase